MLCRAVRTNLAGLGLVDAADQQADRLRRLPDRRRQLPEAAARPKRDGSAAVEHALYGISLVARYSLSKIVII